MIKHGLLTFSSYDREDWEYIKQRFALIDFDPYEPDWNERYEA